MATTAHRKKEDILVDIWELLGKPIKRNQPAWASQLEARELILKHNLPYTSLTKIGTTLNINFRSEAPKIFHISEKTMQRRKKEHRLNFDESITVFRFAEIIARATDVFGDRDIAIGWFKEENSALGNKEPITLLNDDIGRKLVEETLGRIKHGIYS